MGRQRVPLTPAAHLLVQLVTFERGRFLFTAEVVLQLTCPCLVSKHERRLLGDLPIARSACQRWRWQGTQALVWKPCNCLLLELQGCTPEQRSQRACRAFPDAATRFGAAMGRSKAQQQPSGAQAPAQELGGAPGRGAPSRAADQCGLCGKPVAVEEEEHISGG